MEYISHHRLPILIIILVLLAAGGVTTGLRLEERDAFCASCHTEPESTYYQRSLAAPSDLASAHAALDAATVRCIDCHSGIGPGGRARSLGQGAWDLARFLLNAYDQPAHTTQPVGDAACLKCHTPPGGDPATDDAQEFASSQHYHRGSYLAAWVQYDPDPYGTCAFCHQAHAEGTIAAMHFTLEQATTDGCNDCHRDLADWQPSDD